MGRAAESRPGQMAAAQETVLCVSPKPHEPTEPVGLWPSRGLHPSSSSPAPDLVCELFTHSHNLL